MPARIHGTIEYFATQTWNSLQRRTTNGTRPNWGADREERYLRRGIRLEMTRTDYYSWCQNHREDILSLYNSNDTPSIDRINSDGHYSIDNIRVIPEPVNAGGGRETIKEQYSKKVTGVSLAGPTVEFDSLQDAERSGFGRRYIKKSLAEGRSYKGYTWSLGEAEKTYPNQQMAEKK
jgi:hypothetical protein